MGYLALPSNTSSGSNTGVGALALGSATGAGNIALGAFSGFNISTGSDNISIGHVGSSGDSEVIRIGTPGTQSATFVAGISGATSSSGVAVYVNSSGQLGTATSSARFKENVRDMADSSAGIHALRPVVFRYRADLDSEGLEQYGLLAEDVAEHYPNLVTYDEQGRPQAVRYHFVNAMLLNEVQKQAERLGSLEKRLAEKLGSLAISSDEDLQTAGGCGRSPSL